MPNRGGPVAAFQVDQTLAQSSLAEIPKLAKAARESHYSIETEMMAWENDKDPTHLLRVIAMLQQMIAEHTSALMTLTAETHAAHGALRELAAGLDRDDTGPAQAGADRRDPVAAAMDRLGTRISTASQPLRSAAVEARPLMVVEMQSLLHRQQQMFELFGELSTLEHDAKMAAIANFR